MAGRSRTTNITNATKTAQAAVTGRRFFLKSIRIINLDTIAHGLQLGDSVGGVAHIFAVPAGDERAHNFRDDADEMGMPLSGLSGAIQVQTTEAAAANTVETLIEWGRL